MKVETVGDILAELRLEAGQAVYHPHVEQGSLDWLEARLGLITASEMKLLLTPLGKAANNEKSRAHLFELAAQRITRNVEPSYVSDDMLRGQVDEIAARELYGARIAPVHECGFITRTFGDVTIGYSPDGLVGDFGLIECKSRSARFQVETILDGSVPDEFMAQIQTALLVTGREWLDFVSYCGGLPMFVHRVEPCQQWKDRILECATAAEARIRSMVDDFEFAASGMIQTERRIEQDMII